MEKDVPKQLSVSKRELSPVNLTDIALVFREALEENFIEVSVAVVGCPDLTEAPYRLAAKGLCGATKVADVGGTGYLAPFPQLDHKYSLEDIGALTGLPDECFILGAGAGPYQDVGCNCELMANAFVGTNGQTNISSKVAKLTKNGDVVVSSLTTPNLALLGNFFLSRGESGKVIEVRAKHRTGSENFITILRQSLTKSSPGNLVGAGGIFLVKTGKVRVHVMPDFSVTPLLSAQDAGKWLKYFEIPGPLIFQSVFVSESAGLDLRLEHSHGYSLADEHGDSKYGGHYEQDTTPDEVEYVGFFNVAESVYRIDRPGP